MKTADCKQLLKVIQEHAPAGSQKNLAIKILLEEIDNNNWRAARSHEIRSSRMEEGRE